MVSLITLKTSILYVEKTFDFFHPPTACLELLIIVNNAYLEYCDYCKTLKNTYFEEDLQMTASIFGQI